MSNYSIHTTTNCLIGAPFIYYGLFCQTAIPTSLILVACLSFLTATFLLSPDLDLRHSIPTKNWGIFRIIWLGYPKLFKHRGSSHSILYSSFTKTLYLLLVSGLTYFIFVFLKSWIINYDFQNALSDSKDASNVAIEQGLEFFHTNKSQVFAIFVGLVASDWSHIFTDKVFSTIKKKWNKKRHPPHPRTR